MHNFPCVRKIKREVLRAPLPSHRCEGIMKHLCTQNTCRTIHNRSIRKGAGLAHREVITVGLGESFKGNKNRVGASFSFLKMLSQNLHKLGAFKQEKCIVSQSKGQKSKMKVLAGFLLRAVRENLLHRLSPSFWGLLAASAFLGL